MKLHGGVAWLQGQRVSFERSYTTNLMKGVVQEFEDMQENLNQFYDDPSEGIVSSFASAEECNTYSNRLGQ